VIAGRTLIRAQRLARELGATAVGFHDLPQALEQADIVVSATAARSFCIRKDLVARAMERRPERPLLLIDLAVPRDIDPVVRELPGVVLFDIDDLQPFIDRLGPGSSSGEADSAVEDEVARFVSWWEGREIVPTIAALRDQAEEIRQMELTKTLGRLPNLSIEERRRIDALTSAIVKKLLHRPIMYLKESDGQPNVEAVRELFALTTVSD
jgi:glutamyl-tRNA reductase